MMDHADQLLECPDAVEEMVLLRLDDLKRPLLPSKKRKFGMFNFFLLIPFHVDLITRHRDNPFSICNCSCVILWATNGPASCFACIVLLNDYERLFLRIETNIKIVVFLVASR